MLSDEELIKVHVKTKGAEQRRTIYQKASVYSRRHEPEPVKEGLYIFSKYYCPICGNDVEYIRLDRDTALIECKCGYKWGKYNHLK